MVLIAIPLSSNAQLDWPVGVHVEQHSAVAVATPHT